MIHPPFKGLLRSCNRLSLTLINGLVYVQHGHAYEMCAYHERVSAPSYKESDLIGTWVGKPGTATFTTLTLHEDHTYKQIYKDPYINLIYESEEKPKWRLEYRKSGIHLLHLEKMKDCDNDLSSCEKSAATKPAPILWGDPCEGTLIKQEDEVGQSH